MKFTKSILKKTLSLLLILTMLMSVGIMGISSVSAADTQIAQVSETAGEKTIYFAPNGYWSNLFAVYVWEDGAYDSGKWFSMSKVSGVDGLYSVSIDETYTNIIFCSRYTPAYSWDTVEYKTENLTIPAGCNYLSLAGVSTAMWGVYTADDSGFVDPAGNQTVYFVPNEEWMNIQSLLYHDFAIRAWSEANTEGTWAQFELVEGTYGTYPCVLAAEIPASFDNVEFCRIEGSIEDGMWNIWEKTGVQVVPSSSNRFTQYDDVETGTWDYYVAPEVDPDNPDTTDPTETTPTTPVEPDAPVATKTVYITPNEEWLSYTTDGIGSISAYSWDLDKLEGTWTWVDAVPVENNIYSVQIPQTDSNILFGLCFGSTPDVVWGQTDDQEIPLGSNHFIHDADGATGTWTYYGNAAVGNYYSVVFLNDDGKFISAQVVAEGLSAVAPLAPTKESDAQYTYTFAGWDRSFANVTSDTVVFATYSKTVNSYLVTFTDKDGATISAETVEYGKAATAPQAPEVDGYDFAGWDTDFTCVTSELTVKATYKKIATPAQPSTTGTIKIDIAGGSGFTISVNGATARPQGTSYTNTKAPKGATITVTANATADVTFVAWVDVTGTIVSTEMTYTFVSSGNDYYKAVYTVEVKGVQLVTFKHDKTGSFGRVLDSQYYASADTIVFPDDPTAVGYDFAGWSMTEKEIQAAIAAGQDVTVTATWTRQIVYVNVTVTGGTGTGKYNANSAVTVVADTAPAGQKFAYWTDAEGNIKAYTESYKFFPSTDTTLVAVFVAEDVVVEETILVFIDTIDTVSVEGKNLFYYSWYCPTSYEFVDAGILAVNKDNYNEETFYVGTTDGNVYDRGPSGTAIKPANSTYWTKGSVASGQTWVAKAYVQYKDASGEIITVYSELVEATKE